MRSSKSRSRNKSNRNRNTLGNVVNRVFDSNGPEGKVRGTPQQIIDKYNQLARDASLSNDRVATENFQQHAEHYLRMLGEATREQDQRREQQERENRDRQAQRDRDQRPARDGNDQDRPDRPPRPVSQSPATASDERGETMSSDVLDLTGDDEGPGLVDTPESRAERPAKAVENKGEGRPRAPRHRQGADVPADAVAGPEAPSEATGGDKPKKPRAPRKPRKKPETDGPSAEAQGAPGDMPPPDAAE